MRTAIALAALVAATPAAAATTVFSASGGEPASIQGAVDAFRAALGPDNGTTLGSQAGGRREINWDEGGDAAGAQQLGSFSTDYVSRGLGLLAPSGVFEISGQPLPEFGDLNPTYPDIFQPFSSPRMLAVVGTHAGANVTDALLFIPGNDQAAGLSIGFGVVFLDVDLAGVTGIEFRDIWGSSLGSYYAPTADNGLSFLGVLFDTPIVAAVRITSGNTTMGLSNDGGLVDVVALDDFIFGEPMTGGPPIPEPSTWVLLMLGFGLAGAIIRHHKHRSAEPAFGHEADIPDCA